MRRLKPQKVDTMLMRCGTVTLYLDRDKLDFFATLGLEEVRDPTIAGLRKLVATKLKDWTPENWEGFIVVRASSPDHDSHNVIGNFSTRHVDIEFEFYRGERAKKLDGQLVERVHWLDREAALKKARRGGYYDELKDRLEKRTSEHHVPESYVLLPYSDEAWAKLCEAERQLREARAQIYKTVHSKQFLKALGSSSFKLLPAKGEP